MAYKFFTKEQDPNMIGLDEKLMSMLDNMRFVAKIPIHITSGVRTPEKNKQVGGAPNSSHLKGLACDILCENDEQRMTFVYSALFAGFKRIGLGKKHIHLDIDKEKAQSILFIE